MWDFGCSGTMKYAVCEMQACVGRLTLDVCVWVCAVLYCTVLFCIQDGDVTADSSRVLVYDWTRLDWTG